jgi:hypothetical protein
MDLAIGSVAGTGSGKAARTPVVAASSAAGPDGAGGVGAGAGAEDGAVFDALPTIVETFFEMNALDFAVREAPLPGSWTRYQSPCTACT